VLPEKQGGNIIDFSMRYHSHLRFQCIEIVIPMRKVWVWATGTRFGGAAGPASKLLLSTGSRSR
jgi:hypothetical protein